MVEKLFMNKNWHVKRMIDPVKKIHPLAVLFRKGSLKRS